MSWVSYLKEENELGHSRKSNMIRKEIDGLCTINILDQNINDFSLYSNIGKDNRDPMSAEKVGNFFSKKRKRKSAIFFFFFLRTKVGNLNCLKPNFIAH